LNYLPNPFIAQLLIITGSFILATLGGLHLFYTFFSDRFSPRNALAETEMKNTSPRLTGRTTMWKAWVGFNASHSLGALFFGVINIFLVVSYFTIYSESWLIHVINLLTLGFYFFLGKAYWFRIPFRGIAISTFCFILAWVLLLLK
jgi:hypothetical protein